MTPIGSGAFRASLGALLLAALGCGGAAAPTTELQTARNMYSQARSGETAQLNPSGVHEAYQALQAAEKVHEDDAGSERERHYAYIALRKSELAISEASEALAKQEQQRAEQTYQAQLEQQSREAIQQLNETQQAMQQTARQQELEEARAAAEQAEAELRREQALTEQAGRMVISLSGVSFETGGAELSEAAQQRLDTVVQALRAYPDHPIVIEGYTDARGSDKTNQELSRRRAEAVQAYLEQRGIEPSRLRAVGKGEANPIASNDTPEGRASNRRVEIIVDREGTEARSAERSGEATDRQNVSGRDSAEPAEPGATPSSPPAKPGPVERRASPPSPMPPPQDLPSEPSEPSPPPGGDSPYP